MDIEKMLGADQSVSVVRFTVYLPDRDKDGDPISDLDLWVETLMMLLCQINTGATALPPARGVWQGEGPIVGEWTVLVYSYVRSLSRFQNEFYRIKAFIDTFGTRTMQEAVFVEWSGEARVRSDGGDLSLRYLSRAYNVTDYSRAVSIATPLPDLLKHLSAGLE
jgi:hypothetical protein